MSLGLYLKGRSRNAALRGEPLLEAARAWASKKFGEEHVHDTEDTEDAEDMAESPASLLIEAYAGAPEVELSLEGEELLRISAQTSNAGPGYHAWLCDALQELGSQLSLTWLTSREDEESQDETGFFETQDYGALETQMLSWLREVCLRVARTSSSQVALGMPTSHVFEGGPVLTPLGPRDAAWVQSVIEEPRRGTDFFAWWERGAGAGAELGKALTRMWLELRWRPPEDEDEEFALHEVIEALQRAFSKDSKREYPWREWAEILEHLDVNEEDPVARLVRSRVAAQGPEERPRMGYRRSPVRTRLPGGWSVRLPGEFSEGWSEEGTFVAGAGERAVWISLSSSSEPEPPEEPLEDSPGKGGVVLNSEHWSGSARLTSHEEDGEQSFVLDAQLTSRSGQLRLSVQYLDPEDRAWALELVHSVEVQGGPREP